MALFENPAFFKNRFSILVREYGLYVFSSLVFLKIDFSKWSIFISGLFVLENNL